MIGIRQILLTSEIVGPMTTDPHANCQLILFGRYPVPGRTKTRLIPGTGPLGAADLQRQMTEKSLATILACGLPAGSVTFCYTGGGRQQVTRWLGQYAIDIAPQAGNTLGERMQSAIDGALDSGNNRVVLVGTDIPRLSAEHLWAAFEALKDNDLVIGPSRDGGYWLIGMRRRAQVFNPIDWGTARVFSQTMAAAAALGLSTARLPELNDLDTAADLADWRPDGRWRRPYLSVIIPTLNEAPSIETAIEAAASPDCEIIVADGGSTDGTVARARMSGAAVIAAPSCRARQQNAAAEAARGRVLLFVHADTRLPRNYGAQIFDTLLCPEVVAGAFRFKTDYDRPGMRLIEKAAHLRATLFQMPYGDQALFVSKKIFERAGRFPEIAIAEDLFLVRRLVRLGRIAIAPGAAVTSGRRWRAIGLWRATVINYIIALGCLSGVDPDRLAPLYRLWIKK